MELRRQLAASSPRDVNLAAALARELFLLGQFDFEHERPMDARPAVQESVNLFTELLKQSPDQPRLQAGLARGLTRLATIDPDQTKGATVDQAQSLLSAAAKKLPDDAEVQTDLRASSITSRCGRSRHRRMSHEPWHCTTSRARRGQANGVQPGLIGMAIRFAKSPSKIGPPSWLGRTAGQRCSRARGRNQRQQGVRAQEPGRRSGSGGTGGCTHRVRLGLQSQTRFDQAIESWNDAARTYEALWPAEPKRRRTTSSVSGP